jgi:hypothetical protein
MCEFSIDRNLTLSTAKCFSLTPHLFIKNNTVTGKGLHLHSYFILKVKFSPYLDQIETTLKFLFKTFLTDTVPQ